MDVLSACAFLAIWLLRDQFDYDTLRGWLLWPVVFEMFAAVALMLAGMMATIRMVPIRHAAFLFVALIYLASAWLIGAIGGMPNAWLIAVWLLVARLVPPTGLRFGTGAHQEWVFQGAGYSGLLWGAGFVLTVVLMLVCSEPAVRDATGELHSTSPAWIFPLVWTPYFLAEALLRGWRETQPQASGNR